MTIVWNICLNFVMPIHWLPRHKRVSKILQLIATRLFKYRTSYNCKIENKEDKNRVERTIDAIGKYLIELQISTSSEYQKLDGVFFDNLTKKLPNLQRLETISHVSPNAIFDSVRNLQKLEHLSVHFAIDPR